MVLLDGVRTSVGRLGGRWSEVPAVELGGRAVAGLLDRLGGADRVGLDHVVLANVVQAGNGQNPARQAGVLGGVPRTVPALTLNDVCLSSMTSVAVADRMVRAGEATSVLVGGFESMTRAPRDPDDLLVRDGLWCALDDVGMGPLSDAENDRLGVGRAAQDEFAVASHQRADAATRAGRLSTEMLSGEAVDEGIRSGSTLERVAALAPAFGAEGTITAASASQMSDAAAVGVVTTRSHAERIGVTPLARVVAHAVVAGETSSLHLQPAQAARAVLDRAGLSISDVDVWEVNEAFAGVVLASATDLGVPLDRVNVNGGAISLGHPLGASGFRLVLTLAHELRRRGAEWGVATICGGGGQGRALLLRAE